MEQTHRLCTPPRSKYSHNFSSNILILSPPVIENQMPTTFTPFLQDLSLKSDPAGFVLYLYYFARYNETFCQKIIEKFH